MCGISLTPGWSQRCQFSLSPEGAGIRRPYLDLDYLNIIVFLPDVRTVLGIPGVSIGPLLVF